MAERKWKSLELHLHTAKSQRVLVLFYQKRSSARNVHPMKLRKYLNLVRQLASHYIDVWIARNHLIDLSVFKWSDKLFMILR